MKPMKRKIYVAILALCAINAFAQTVIVDKSNLTNAGTTGGSETVVVGKNNSTAPSGQTIVGTGNNNTAFGAISLVLTTTTQAKAQLLWAMKTRLQALPQTHEHSYSVMATALQTTLRTAFQCCSV